MEGGGAKPANLKICSVSGYLGNPCLKPGLASARIKQ